MLASVQALLNGLIDYAGLFPPAQLPLEQALSNYAAYRQGAEAWLLGRFIVPAARLAEVSAAGGELLGQGVPWSFSVLGRGGNTIAEFMEGLRSDLESIAAFRQRHVGRAVVDVYEVKLPKELLPPPSKQILLFYVALMRLLSGGVTETLQVFCEPVFGPTWSGMVPTVLDLLNTGLKLRCGGLEATAFPSVEQMAFALDVCHNSGKPFKATAGLHHPLRHTDAALNVKMHGFLNVFGAAVLAAHHKLYLQQLQAVIEVEDPGHFVFEDQQFRWQEFAVNVEQIRSARERVAVSFGSCSFDEPCEGLRALGLLP